MKTVNDLLAFFNDNLGSGYVWGSRGEVCTEALLEKWRLAFSTVSTTPWYDGNSGLNYKKRCVKWIGKRVFDCSSMFDVFLGVDRNAQGYYSISKTKGRINTFPEIAGLQVFKENVNGYKYHIGLYIGNGKVIEAKGADYGVILSMLPGGGWSDWAYCDGVDYSQGSSGGGEDVLQKGDKGDQVTAWQKSLLEAGYKMTNNGIEYGADGSFGAATENGTKSFQKAVLLPETGIVNTATFCSMLTALMGKTAAFKAELDAAKIRIAQLTADLANSKNELLVAQNETKKLSADLRKFSTALDTLLDLVNYVS